MLWNTPGNEYIWPVDSSGKVVPLKIIPISEETGNAVRQAMLDANCDFSQCTDSVWEVVRTAIESDRKFPPNKENG
jgi:hypothetical protein